MYNTSSPSILTPTVKKDQYVNFSLSQYVVSATPDTFNLSCTMNNAVYFALTNQPRDKLHFILYIPEQYVCKISHEVSSKQIVVELKESIVTTTPTPMQSK